MTSPERAARDTPRPRRTRRAADLVTGVAGAVLIAGCGVDVSPGNPSGAASPDRIGSTGGSAGRQDVTIDATNALRFSPSTIRARVGVVRIKLVDTGAYPHDIEFTSLHRMSTTVSGIPGSMTTTLTVTFPKPGRYPFHCTYHSSAGMTGVFLVTR